MPTIKDDTKSISNSLLGVEEDSLKMELSRICAFIENTSLLKSNDDDDGLSKITEALERLKDTDAAKLVKLTNETYEIANKMSANIRKKDLERTRLLEVLNILNKVELLNDQIIVLMNMSLDEDLERVCRLFQSINSEGDQSKVKEAWSLRYGNGKQVDDILKSVEDSLYTKLSNFMTDLCNNNPGQNIDESTMKAFKLLPFYEMLRKREFGLLAISEILQKYCLQSFNSIVENSSSNIDFRYVAKLSKINEFTNGLTQWTKSHLYSIADFNGTEGDVAQVLRNVFVEAEKKTTNIIRSFDLERQVSLLADEVNEERKIDELVQSSNKIRDLDLRLVEIAIIIQNGLNLIKMRGKIVEGLDERHQINTPNLIDLISTIEHLLSRYIILEKAYFKSGVKIALSMNQVEISEKCSTCVEDVFFLAKKCGTRCISIGEFSFIIDLFSSLKHTLLSEFLPSLSMRCRQLYPDPKSNDSISITVNDAFSSSLYVERLVDEMRNLMNDSLLFSIKQDGMIAELDNLSNSKINNALNDLDTVTDSLTSIVKSGIETIFTTQIKTKLASVLTRISNELASVSPQTTNASFDYEPSILRLVTLLDKSIVPSLGSLVDSNRIQVSLLLAKEIISVIEKGILARAKWEKNSSELLEQNIRKLASYFSDLTELQSKDLFVRVAQMISILVADNQDEIDSIINNDATTLDAWRVSEAEMKILLKARDN